MDIAKCTLNEKIYTALRFSKLPPNELSNKRKHLVCTECQADVFFRKASRSGQAACFGARPHLEECSFSSPETQKLEGKGSDEDIVYNLGQMIEVDLDFGATVSNLDVDLTVNDEEDQARGGRHLGHGTRPNSHMHRRLSTLLRNLVNSKEFRSSNQKIEIEGREPTTVRKFFVNFNDVESVPDEEFHGYWGMLTDARLDSEGSLWLNSGGYGDVSCVIPSEDVDALYARYKLEDEEDLAGAFILLIGTKKTSQNGKEYIRPASINHIDIRRIIVGTALKDKFFITDKKRLAFLLKNHGKGIFDEELGIKKKHYIDKNAAKEWKAGLIREFHPDKNLGDASLNYDEVTSCINKIYNRMVGKA